MIAGVTLPQPRAPFMWVETPWGPALQCESLNEFATHVFTARGIDVPHADEGTGWLAIADWFGVPASHVWRLKQVHGVAAHTDALPCDGTWPDGDLLATDQPEVAVAVRTADCVPILLADRRTGVVAAVHAGWRGTVAGAAGRMVDVMRERFGTRADDLVAAVGPCIGPHVYEVGEGVIDAFAAAWPAQGEARSWWTVRDTPGKYLLDLWTATRDQLVAAGLDAAHIHVAHLCTATHAGVFHSWRANGAAAGRMVAAVSPRRSRSAGR